MSRRKKDRRADKRKWRAQTYISSGNLPETLFLETARKAGWEVTKRGWPDFACWHPEKGFVAVEVKPYQHHKLSVYQERLIQQLASHGIKCYRWSPNTGFTRIRPATSVKGIGKL